MGHERPRFGELLTRAIKRMNADQYASIAAIELEIANRLNVSRYTVQSWRWRRAPKEMRQIEFLVRYFAKIMGQDWSSSLLYQTDYPSDEAKALLRKLFLNKHEDREPINDGIEVQLKSLKCKLEHLRSPKDYPVALVGGIYLDQRISPIKTITLKPQEWSNIDRIKYDLGGAGVWVGRFLSILYGKKSHLFSIRGKSKDPFTRCFQERLEKETLQPDDTEQTYDENNNNGQCWLYDHVVEVRDEDTHTAVTIQLIQAKHQFTTMLTHVGVLNMFGWDMIQDDLCELLKDGGVLYISGFLKTNLSIGLVDHLAKFSNTNTLICIDHGHLIRGLVNQDAVASLYDAFDLDLIDIYICSLEELWDFCHFQDNRELPPLSGSDHVKEILGGLLASTKLPVITVVRDNLSSNTQVYVLIGKTIYLLEEAEDKGINECIGPGNAFTAAFIHYLTDSQQEDYKFDDSDWRTIKWLVIDAARYAYDQWHQALNINPFVAY